MSLEGKYTLCFGSIYCPHCESTGSFKLFRPNKNYSTWYGRIDHYENAGFPHGKYQYMCYLGKVVNDRIRYAYGETIFLIDFYKRKVTALEIDGEEG